MKTAEGMVEFAAPQVRDTAEPFVSGIRQNLAGRTRALEDLAVELYARGLSTREASARKGARSCCTSWRDRRRTPRRFGPFSGHARARARRPAARRLRWCSRRHPSDVAQRASMRTILRRGVGRSVETTNALPGPAVFPMC